MSIVDDYRVEQKPVPAKDALSDNVTLPTLYDSEGNERDPLDWREFMTGWRISGYTVVSKLNVSREWNKVRETFTFDKTERYEKE